MFFRSNISGNRTSSIWGIHHSQNLDISTCSKPGKIKKLNKSKHPFLKSQGSGTANITSHLPLRKVSLLSTCNGKGSWAQGLAMYQERKEMDSVNSQQCQPQKPMSDLTFPRQDLSVCGPVGVAFSCLRIINDFSTLLVFFPNQIVSSLRIGTTSMVSLLVHSTQLGTFILEHRSQT